MTFMGRAKLDRGAAELGQFVLREILYESIAYSDRPIRIIQLLRDA